MIITDIEKQNAKKMQKSNINFSIINDKTIIIIPNPKVVSNTLDCVNDILYHQLEDPKNIKIFVLNYKYSSNTNRKNIYKQVNFVDTKTIYKTAYGLVTKNKYAKKIIWINPNVIIPPDFINKMRNVPSQSILRPLHWYTNKDKRYENWEHVLSDIEDFVGIDGVFTWAMNREDFLSTSEVFNGKKIDWCKFLYILQKNNIDNLYTDMRILMRNNCKFINLEEY